MRPYLDRLSGSGDACIDSLKHHPWVISYTLPALTDATNACGDIRFDWVCEPAFSDIPRWHPSVGYVLAIPLRRWKGQLHRLLFSGSDLAAFKQVLGAERYDVVIDLQGLLAEKAHF